mmetsp:Transcript_122532/g.240471  ORF Transcript_122532/g.240471 Transcript_122532/m.240471 type:complete len:214 (-) Transcript_122532:80-721(-)
MTTTAQCNMLLPHHVHNQAHLSCRSSATTLRSGSRRVRRKTRRTAGNGIKVQGARIKDTMMPTAPSRENSWKSQGNKKIPLTNSFSELVMTAPVCCFTDLRSAISGQSTPPSPRALLSVSGSFRPTSGMSLRRTANSIVVDAGCPLTALSAPSTSAVSVPPSGCACPAASACPSMAAAAPSPNGRDELSSVAKLTVGGGKTKSRPIRKTGSTV